MLHRSNTRLTSVIFTRFISWYKEGYILLMRAGLGSNNIKDQWRGNTSKWLTSGPKHTQPHSTQLHTPENGCRGSPARLLWGSLHCTHWNMLTLPLKFDIAPACNTGHVRIGFESLESSPQTSHSIIPWIFRRSLNCRVLSLGGKWQNH